MRIMDYIVEGGPIMYILVLLNIIGITMIIWKVFSLISLKSKISASGDIILKKYQDKISKNSVPDAVKHELLKDEIGYHLSPVETGLSTIKIIASIAPLLGLLGTVTGILTAFSVISKSGLDDPSLFAGGISSALITTVGGLIVAIPHLVGYNYLVSGLDQIEDGLEEYTAQRAF